MIKVVNVFLGGVVVKSYDSDSDNEKVCCFVKANLEKGDHLIIGEETFIVTHKALNLNTNRLTLFVVKATPISELSKNVLLC